MIPGHVPLVSSNHTSLHFR